MRTTTLSWRRSKMAIASWVGLLLLLQLVGDRPKAAALSLDCGRLSASVQFSVSHDQAGNESLVKVTYNNRLSGEGRMSSKGTTFLQCCEWTWPHFAQNSSVDLEVKKSLKSPDLNCSILDDDLDQVHSNDAGIAASGLGFCLRVHSSIDTNYIVASDGGENTLNRGCELRADAVVSLSLYLANRLSSIPASVQTRAVCSNDDVPWKLTISGNWFPGSEDPGVSSSLSGVELGVVEWVGASSSDRLALFSQEYEATLHPRTSKDPGANDDQKVFEVSIAPLEANRVVEAATVFHLGRRSLLARAPKVRAGSDRFQWGAFVTGTLISLAGISMLAILCAGKKEDDSPGEFLDTVPIHPPRFSYSKLQKATKNYSQKLGDGAFGSVYEGTLPNGTRVAVKMLEKASVQGEKQFRAEVASMGAIRHLNLVRLHGFCSEGAHRLLVYEYMPNGSLDSWLFGKKQGDKLLDWEQRLNIALGTARALAYLHEECSDHIIHLDVKPENILLDHQFCPKLSDFGLAKLMDREQSRVVTTMRGTPGYLAPEWLLPHAAVTAKTDVYSFGMVLLELISGRENTIFSLGKEQWYFPAWAFKLTSEQRTMELLDKRLHVEEVEYFHKQDAMRAIHVALLCIQDDPGARPSMSRVVHMLQGHIEPEPLNARQSAINPPRRLVTAFAASGIDTSKGSTEKPFELEKLQSDPKSERSRDSKGSSREDSRKNSWSNENDPILSELLQSDMRNDHFAKPRNNDMNFQRITAATTPVLSSRLPVVTESPRIHGVEIPKPRTTAPRHEKTLEELNNEVDNFKLEPPPPPPAVLAVSHYRSSKSERQAGTHTLGSNQKCIPPWPVKGDIILLRGSQGDFHGIVRDVRVQTKQMRLGLLHRLSSETRWSVREEESQWRHWNESLRTLDFWVPVRWATIPERGQEKFPVEWQVR